MDKESIIRKLKENKKSLLAFSIIFLSGLIVSISILTINLPQSEPKPEPIIASDDVMVIEYYIDNSTYGERVDNSETLREGYHISNENWSTREFYRIWIQFKLPTKLRNWSKCILQVHTFNFVDDNEKGKYGFSFCCIVTLIKNPSARL